MAPLCPPAVQGDGAVCARDEARCQRAGTRSSGMSRRGCATAHYCGRTYTCRGQRPVSDADLPDALQQRARRSRRDGGAVRGAGVSGHRPGRARAVRLRRDFSAGFYSADHCDAEDGYDTVEWAAELPWSDGKVGTFGNSYCGWTQWELAHTRPPHLVAMVPQGIAANLLDRELSGVLRLGRVLWWSINTLAPDERRRAGDTSGPHTTDEAARLWSERDRSKWLWYLPLADIPDAVMSGVGEHWRRWLADHTTDFFGFLEKHRQVAVPALSTRAGTTSRSARSSTSPGCASGG